MDNLTDMSFWNTIPGVNQSLIVRPTYYAKAVISILVIDNIIQIITCYLINNATILQK